MRPSASRTNRTVRRRCRCRQARGRLAARRRVRRLAGGASAWTHGVAREAAGHAKVSRGRGAGACGHHRHRGGHRRSQRHRHDRGGCRPVRPRAAPSAAGARPARRQAGRGAPRLGFKIGGGPRPPDGHGTYGRRVRAGPNTTCRCAAKETYSGQSAAWRFGAQACERRARQRVHSRRPMPMRPHFWRRIPPL